MMVSAIASAMARLFPTWVLTLLSTPDPPPTVTVAARLVEGEVAQGAGVELVAGAFASDDRAVVLLDDRSAGSWVSQ